MLTNINQTEATHTARPDSSCVSKALKKSRDGSFCFLDNLEYMSSPRLL